MKKSLVTLLAAATLVAATAPAFANGPKEIFEKSAAEQKALEAKAQLQAEVDAAKVIVAFEANEVAKAKKAVEAAKQDLALADESIQLLRAELAATEKLVGDNQDGGVTNDAAVQRAAELRATINTYEISGRLSGLKAVEKAEAALAQAQKVYDAEKANLDALVAKLAGLNATTPAPATKPAETKKPATAVKAAGTATGQKTLPKTSAAK